MKKVVIFVALMFSLAAVASAVSEMTGIRAQDVSGKPDVYCKVTKEPNPLLLGGWKCIHHKYDQKLHQYVDEQVEYWLVKSGDRYGFYFYRVKPGEKTYKGWRECIINGDTITSGAGYKIFIQNGEVFYTWGTGGDKPTKMNRIEGS